MLEEAGKDSTEAFEDVGHSDEARDQLKPLYIGEFEGASKETKQATQAKSGSSGASSSGPSM